MLGAEPLSFLFFRHELLKAWKSTGLITLAAGAPSSDLRSSLERLGIKYLDYPVQRNGMNVSRDLKTFISLWKMFRAQKPDVVLAYTIKPVIWGGLALWFFPGIRFYALITGLGYAFQSGNRQGGLTSLVSLLYRLSLLRAEKVIFQNAENLEELVARGCVSRGKCARVYGSGINLSHFCIAPLPANPMVFLGIGRLLGDKGVREFVNAARRVHAVHPNVRFQWLGGADPSLDGIPRDEVRYWQEDGVLEYLGMTSDVRPYLAACHVFVLPSYHEGMPHSTLEAMAMGRAVLTTDVPGCRETVEQGLNGFLVPKADATALAERMIWFIKHPEVLHEMGQASRRLAEERFDVHKVNAEMLRIMRMECSYH